MKRASCFTWSPLAGGIAWQVVQESDPPAFHGAVPWQLLLQVAVDASLRAVVVRDSRAGRAMPNFNPFVVETATFGIASPTVPNGTMVTGATFHFGVQPVVSVPAVCTQVAL